MLSSLRSLDLKYPKPDTVRLLENPENKNLLEYIAYDAFGAHVFPGDVMNFSLQQFFNAMNKQLNQSNPIHLWLNLAVCEQRCFFCQFPIVVSKNKENQPQLTQKWLDANLHEAKLWLKNVPNLSKVPIGEFNILGGTPTLFSNEQLKKLIKFYRENFNFQADTTIRIEGTASTYTDEKFKILKTLGITKISAGIQSFNDSVLSTANCIHRQQDALNYINKGHEYGFDSVNIDLIYGLANQTVQDFLSDVQKAISLKVSCIFLTKLHLKTFAEPRTAVSGTKQALWQMKTIRENLENKGCRWPSLGEQYQMREQVAKLLQNHGYKEHPTMYFYHPDKQPEKWKALMVDQDKQFADVSFGMGGSSSCMNAEAINATSPHFYFEKINQDIPPIESIRGFTGNAVIRKSIQMALSSCQPLSDTLFKQRFPNNSLFDEHWLDIFKKLEKRQLVQIDYQNHIIELTPVGQTLVEAIMHMELN